MWQLLPPLALGLQTMLRYNATERSSFLEMQQFPGFAAASYFKQKLDHFLPADTRTFDQRYFESRSYWAGPQAVPDPPVFFYIGGEAPLYGLPSGWVDELAKEHGALLVAFEHRFYGKSQPFDAITTDNLAYLSTAQALLDIMSFRGFFTDELRRAGGSGSGPWFAFGGSYAGALAAWLRAFFPGQFAGAIASSGVVQLELGYWRFDRQVAASCGPQCAQVMTYVYGVIDAMLEDPQRNQWVKDRFAAGALTDGDFRYLLADAGSMAVQYGFSERLCAPMVQAATGAGGSVEPLLDAFSNYAQTHFYSTLETGSSEEYSTRYLQQTQARRPRAQRSTPSQSPPPPPLSGGPCASPRPLPPSRPSLLSRGRGSPCPSHSRRARRSRRARGSIRPAPSSAGSRSPPQTARCARPI